MSGVTCLYRRPSGIYAVRLVVPRRLRSIVGRGEVHVSTGLRDRNAAKLAGSRIQVQWRETFMALDSERLTTRSPLLEGGGLISIERAAEAIGLSGSSLMGELLNVKAKIVTNASNWSGWVVRDIDAIERDFDGAFVLNHVEEQGERQVLIGFARPFDSLAAISALMTDGVATVEILRLRGKSAVFLDEPTSVPLAAWMVQKGIIDSIRARLADVVTQTNKAIIVRRVTDVPDGMIVVDAMTAKHGHKRFSELFELYRNHRRWGEDQKRRMATEAGLFVELMGDPTLGSIEVETIHEYAVRLSQLPSDIYQSRRRFGVDSLAELTKIAERENLPPKTARTVQGHVGRVAEILNFATTKGMIAANPASGFKREWSIGKKARTQDERDQFSPDELSAIFSQDYFATGAGAFSAKGSTDWRPFYYWLPLLALTSGGRLNELAQLYLDDVQQAEHDSTVWYLDFNMNEPDKINADDGEESRSDKSLKTVNSIRVVPLHKIVIETGLPEYVAALRNAGHTRLFPELKRDNVKGYGKPAGSWFNERFLGRRLGIKRDGRKTFHSLRHNFATAVEPLDFSERVTAQLLGHERGHTQSWTRYVKDRSAIELKPVLDRLVFPCLSGLGKFNVAAAMKALEDVSRFKAAVSRGKATKERAKT